MTKQKILVIGTGGTIGAKAGSTITADAPLKILNLYTPPAGVDLIGRAAFDRFSEHADLAYLEQLCTYMQGIDYSAYRGVVLLHGSDTLTYTAALLAHLLPDQIHCDLVLHLEQAARAPRRRHRTATPCPTWTWRCNIY